MLTDIDNVLYNWNAQQCWKKSAWLGTGIMIDGKTTLA